MIGAWVISRELNESHLSLASDWSAYYIIGLILFGAIKRNPVTHLKSTNVIHRHKACVYYFFVNKNGGQLEQALCMNNSEFLLHAAYEELNLIQTMTYIHPLQMLIKTLRAQMGSKTLTKAPPPDEIASASSSEKSFSLTLAASASLNQCQVSIVVRKNIEQTLFRLFVKFLYQDQQHAFIFSIGIS